MSETLRQVFCELGFDIDLPTLEKADKLVRDAIKNTDKAAKATDKAAKSAKKSAHERVVALKEQAQEEREVHEAQAAFNATPEGKEHAAWKKKSQEIKGFGDVVGRVSGDRMEKLGESLRKTSPMIDGLATRFNMSSEAIGETFVGASAAAVAIMAKLTQAAFAFATAFAAQAEELRDTARESRVTTTELQELEHAAVQGGVGLDRMRSGVATFGASLRAAQRWGNGTTATLRRLGIQARDSSGHIRPTGELMDEVAVAMEHIQNPMRRARVATQLFGEAGRRMLDIMHTGPGGIRALREELAELGGGVTPEAVAASREYTQATEKLSRAQDSLRSVLAVTLLPVLSWVVTGLAHLGGLLARLTNGTHVLQIALAALGGVGGAIALGLIAAWAPVVAPYLAIAAAVAGVVLVLDDLITFAEGGDSAFGRLIDTMFGVGTATVAVHELHEAWKELGDAIVRAIEAVEEFRGHRAHAVGASTAAPPGTVRGADGSVRTGIDPSRINGGPRTAGAAAPGPRVAIPPILVPATRSVAAPGGSRNAGRVIVRQHTSAPVLHFHGVTDADVIADRVRTTLRTEDANRRDADHPVEDDEG